MAVVAKVDKEAKKLQYLHKIYEKKDDPKFKEKKKVKKDSDIRDVVVKDKRFERKELVRDFLFVLTIILISFSGYLLARFVNF